MIKKISAIVLALVLCLSVVVMPVSAYELGSGSKIAYVVELDKDNYSAGETVTVSLYLYGDAATHFGAGALTFGCHSDVFDQAENAAADVKASATTGDIAGTFYKAFDGQTWGWQTNATIYNNIVTNNTAEENELFDQFIKVAAARQGTSDGTHENSSNTKLGYPGADMNADSENGSAFVSFQLKLKDDLADGTVINVGIPTGPMAKNYTYFDTFKTPGTATTKVKTTAADSEVVFSTTAKVGAPDLTIVKDKTQINFDPDQNGYYEGKFAIRQFVEFDNLLDVFGTAAEAKDGADGTGLTEVGFVYATTDSYNKDDALAVIKAGASSGAYTLDNDAYISTTAKANSFVMGYTVNNIADASVSLTILAYAKYVVDGKEDIATFEIAGDYSEIYSTYESKIPPVKPEA